ncbi:MAG: hypothetical protein KAG66_02185 [Methylococcales bacterium]|nr:hypothetical protein [Methylococcales bacterium]
MMQILLYTVTAILLYVVSDWILVKLEEFRGEPFAARSIVFFIIILILSVVVFEGLQRFLVTSPPEDTATEMPAPKTIPATEPGGIPD